MFQISFRLFSTSNKPVFVVVDVVVDLVDSVVEAAVVWRVVDGEFVVAA